MVWQVDDTDYKWWWPWAVLASLVFVLVFSTQALAEESESIGPDEVSVTDSSYDDKPIRDRLDGLTGHVETIGEKLDQLIAIQTPKKETEARAPESEELAELKSINENIGILIEQNNQDPDAPKQSESLRASTITSVAYGNVSPTTQYATYASNVLPKLGWSDHYVFWQDGQQSYVMAWGDLVYENRTFTGSGCNYLHWYWQSQQAGYVVESGTANISVSSAGYTVLSDLDVWPALPNTGSEVMRREIMLYAVVAVAAASLSCVWGYTLRNRNGT